MGWLCFGLYYTREDNRNLALAHARMAVQKDVVYRMWNANQGGVYVPITTNTPPNPYLAQITNRDLTATTGQRLTLVNPAYMTRMAHELQWKEFGLRGHITSLKPIRPENRADEWEAAALKELEKGAPEYSAIVQINGQREVRLMMPLVTTESCLKCHAQQGYQVGDIRGGISVSAPVDMFLAVGSSRHLTVTALGLGTLWLIGLLGIGGISWLRARRHQELAMAEQEIRSLARFADESPNPILRIGRDGRALYANKAGQALMGAINAPDRQGLNAHWSELIKQSFQSGSPVETEETIGDRIYLCVFVAVAHADYANLFTRDITQRKEAELRVRQLSRAIEQNPASVIITDIKGRIEYVNPKFCQVTGYAAEEAIGRNPNILKSGELPKEAYQAMWKAIANGQTWTGEFHNRKKNGELFWELASINPVRDASGKITHYVAVKEDITGRKLAEAEREKLISDLKKALAEVKTLSGLLPICAGCKKIRNDQGYWSQIESYISLHTDARFSHSYCPDCIQRYFPEVDLEQEKIAMMRAEQRRQPPGQ